MHITQDCLKQMQKELGQILSDVNKGLSILNQHLQYPRDFHNTIIPQVFLHHDVEKTSFRRKGTRKTHVKTHIPKETLVDGIHINSKITFKWYEFTHKTIKKVVGNIQRL